MQGNYNNFTFILRMFHALMLTCALQGGQVLIILLNTSRRQLHVTESKADTMHTTHISGHGADIWVIWSTSKNGRDQRQQLPLT